MIDIHPPQHAAITRREFFTHLGIVVLGILIAIGLEQTVEHLHHARERRALVDNFRQECADNLEIFQRDLNLFQQNIAWERSSLAILRNATPHGGYITVTLPPEPGSGFTAPSRSVWSVAKSSGKVELLPENLAEIFDRVDNESVQWNNLVQSRYEYLERVRSFTDRAGSPQNTDRTMHLTLTQRDDAASLFNNLFVKDKQFRVWTAYWQGASQAVLAGVQSRDQMSAYIRRASAASAQP